MRYIVIFYLFLSTLSFSNDIYPKELDLKDVPITDLFATLSKYSEYVIIGDSYVATLNVDCYFKKGTPIEEILDVIQKTYGLNRIKNGNTLIFKGKKSEQKELLIGRVIDSSNNRELKGIEISLKGKDEIEEKSGGYGEYIFDSLSKGVYFLSVNVEGYEFLGKFIEIKEGVNRVDIQLKSLKNMKKKSNKKENDEIYKKSDIIEYIQLENLNNQEIAKVLKETFEQRLSVSISSGNNAIVLSGDGKVIYEAKKLIAKLDKRKKQVRVIAEIIDVKENVFEDIGFNWVFDGQNRNSNKNNGAFVGTLTSSFIDGIGEVLGSTINFISKFKSGANVLDLTLHLLETSQNLTINALPSIILLNGEEGVLKMTEEVIVGEDREENTNNNKVNYRPIFKEAGIILKVTPFIKDDNSVYLDLNLEASDFKLKKLLKPSDENSGTYNSEGGSKISRSLTTKIRLKHNDIVLIGGLKRKREQKIKSRVPFFSSIPLVGYLFKRDANRVENTDLYIKLKAEVMEEF